MAGKNGGGVRAALRAADSIADICPRVALRFTLGYFRRAPPGRGYGVRATLRDAGEFADICPRVSLRFTLGYFRQAPPGRLKELRCGVGEVPAFPCLRIETWGTRFSCRSRLGTRMRLRMFVPGFRCALPWAIFGRPLRGGLKRSRHEKPGFVLMPEKSNRRSFRWMTRRCGGWFPKAGRRNGAPRFALLIAHNRNKMLELPTEQLLKSLFTDV